MAEAWRRFVDSPKELTFEEQLAEFDDRIDVKKRAISYYQGQLNKSWANPKSINKTIRNLERAIEDLMNQKDRFQATQTLPAEPEYQQDPEMAAENEMNDLLFGHENSDEFTDALGEQLNTLDNEGKNELFEELGAPTSESELPPEGSTEPEGNKYKFVRLYVESVVPINYDPTTRENLTGFENRTEFVDFIINRIEADPVLIAKAAEAMKSNRQLSTVLRLIGGLMAA